MILGSNINADLTTTEFNGVSTFDQIKIALLATVESIDKIPSGK